MTQVFTYGSLMFDDIWQEVVNTTHPSKHASLHGYKRVTILGDSYPVLVPAGGQQQVKGRLYCDVKKGELRKLDHFEGVFYQRQRVTVHAKDGDRTRYLQAYVYLLAPGFEHLASNRPWQPEQFEAEQLQRFKRNYL